MNWIVQNLLKDSLFVSAVKNKVAFRSIKCEIWQPVEVDGYEKFMEKTVSHNSINASSACLSEGFTFTTRGFR